MARRGGSRRDGSMPCSGRADGPESKRAADRRTSGGSATGPLIVTPNHQTYADPPLVSIPVRRRVHYMAWSRLFEIPLFGPFIRLLRAFPVQIESSDPRAAREAVRLLHAGQVVMIFPEGERSPDGRVQRFK